jgi:hypothetical protein
VLAAARALRKVRAAELFEEDPRLCADDLERFLSVEYGLPGHAKRALLRAAGHADPDDFADAEHEYKWAVSHGGRSAAVLKGDEDIFEELFHALPNGHGHDSELTGKPFTDFGA